LEVTALFDRYDPLGLRALGAPAGEYDLEADEIALRLCRMPRPDRAVVERTIDEVFQEYLEESVGVEQLVPLAEEILELLTAIETGGQVRPEFAFEVEGVRVVFNVRGYEASRAPTGLPLDSLRVEAEMTEWGVTYSSVQCSTRVEVSELRVLLASIDRLISDQADDGTRHERWQVRDGGIDLRLSAHGGAYGFSCALDRENGCLSIRSEVAELPIGEDALELARMNLATIIDRFPKRDG
jgi:hypothetical protein